jgi:hypothetical protein
MLNKEISYIAKFNGKGESYQNGVIVKETKKAVLAYFYFSGMMRDYNFAMWIPKSRIHTLFKGVFRGGQTRC